MDEDEKRLNELEKKIKQTDAPSFWELTQAVWQVNRSVMKKQRELN